MDFNDTTEEAAFRAEARSWLDANMAKRSHPNQTWAMTNPPNLSGTRLSCQRD